MGQTIEEVGLEEPRKQQQLDKAPLLIPINPHGWEGSSEASTRPTMTWAGAHFQAPLPTDTCPSEPKAPCPIQQCPGEPRGSFLGQVGEWLKQLILFFILT